MSKRNKKTQQPEQPAAPQDAGQQQAAQLPPDVLAAPAEQPAAPVSKTQILVFWSGVVLALSLAWLLDYLLPGTPESVIERWIMLGFAVFLGFFLYKLK
ncbi:MAG TPA: hypothetical protein DCZ92_04905 [Elusimicrobia bacterium]|nr:MAG: hypothetical protein A2016_07470 [Elusimicrobia bacterium GWF2_62_30]HBA60146.1 hypothetical protein [Elusimicrobiota bacterium]